MLIPNVHEQLRTNVLVVGADVLEMLRRRPQNIEELFQQLRARNNVNVERFYGSLTMLWLIDAIDLRGSEVFLR